MQVTPEDLDFPPYLDRQGRVLIKGVPANTKLFVKEFRESELGTKLVEAGLAYNENLDLIHEKAKARFGKEQINMTEFTAVAKNLWMLGDLKLKAQPVAEAPAPRQLTSSQLAWSEMRQFTDTHSVAECKLRSSKDEAYRKFLHTNLLREINETPVPDAVVAVGTQAVRKDKSVRITEDLRVFADAYKRTSVAEVKRLSSPAMNPVGYKKYTDQLDACIASGLV